MTTFLHDVTWVAIYELGEASRTRLFQLVLLAYAGGIGAATWILVKVLTQLEAALAETLGMPKTERPGAMMQQLLENGDLAQLVQPIIGEGNDPGSVLGEPVLGIWTGMASMALLPLVLLFSASGSIAAEVRTRSLRYLLCRTGRLEIGLGKLAGQLLIALLAVAIGGAVAWGMGLVLMVGNPPVELALAIAGRSLRAVAWALPFAGLGLAASSWLPSPNGARAVATGLLLGMPMLAWQLHERTDTSVLGRLADLANLFLATNTWPDFWATDPGDLAMATGRSLALAVLYYALGHAVFARRNL